MTDSPSPKYDDLIKILEMIERQQRIEAARNGWGSQVALRLGDASVAVADVASRLRERERGLDSSRRVGPTRLA